MANLSQLEQVKLDAQRITLKRIRDAKEEKAYQESKTDAIRLDDERPVEVATEAPAKVVKTKKGK